MKPFCCTILRQLFQDCSKSFKVKITIIFGIAANNNNDADDDNRPGKHFPAMNHSTIMPGNNDDDVDPPRRPGSRLFGVHDISFILNITYNHENYHPFFAGNDIDGQDLFICRTKRFNQIIPGKYSHSIGRCSIPFAQKEWQFNQFELLIESDDTRYEWVKLKKPVIDLPENVLVGGRQFYKKPETTSAATLVVPKNAPKFSKIPFEHILSGDLLRKPKMKMITRRHRFKRAAQHKLLTVDDQWSRNWRGVMAWSSKNNAQQPFAATNLFTEIPVLPKSLSDHVKETTPDPANDPLPINVDKRKLNYFIAKCSLRTGNKISEQIGKIWWKNNIQEWIASFTFGGHEIYCLDYSILTLKTTK